MFFCVIEIQINYHVLCDWKFNFQELSTFNLSKFVVDQQYAGRKLNNLFGTMTTVLVSFKK